MKVALLLCGYLRTYKYTYTNLKKMFLDRYNCDIYIHISEDECKKDKYINENENTDKNISDVKSLYNPLAFICEKEVNMISYLVGDTNYQEKHNSVMVFYKIHQMLQLIHTKLNYLF